MKARLLLTCKTLTNLTNPPAVAFVTTPLQHRPRVFQVRRSRPCRQGTRGRRGAWGRPRPTPTRACSGRAARVRSSTTSGWRSASCARCRASRCHGPAPSVRHSGSHPPITHRTEHGATKYRTCIILW